ncbi:DUF58 domain-containing protein [Trichothermofontia sichuanensis B231]|uniref:DUF58 domain-containing protein n=1 Tax=Trichothermofontia sichuanensis TaxID=3045816 RepID=UPI002247367A|nr:DUF58 domain-containing protein [Trichothermofontia sichuanensis]UZQ55298.1 DUF58 domain-containing protein [Trichothermofontia sichuanensis B231]
MQSIWDWLERHWVAPAYAGTVLLGLTIFFFGAATNTLAGWLYVMSGVSFALLGMAAVLPVRSLRQIRVSRQPIAPISAGDCLSIEILIHNDSDQVKTLLQVQDQLPYVLGPPVQTAIERIDAHSTYRWLYYQPSYRRGIYRWQTLQLRTATPLGLFWCRREQQARAKAIVYPKVLPLSHCPLVDDIGQEDGSQLNTDARLQNAVSGLTRSLRPYRWGDPTRLIHWRTSARYGDLRVRELEVFTGGQTVIIGLDTPMTWPVLPPIPASTNTPPEKNDAFEQAVIVAASLYFYASRQSLQAKIWTATTGLVQGNRRVLEVLAATTPQEDLKADPPPRQPLIWLTCNPASLATLPVGSRWVLWQTTDQPAPPATSLPGLVMQTEAPLTVQLQSPLWVNRMG